MADEQPTAATNGPERPLVDDQWGAVVADALKHVVDVSQGRVFAFVVPRSWPDDLAKRLGRCINRVLEVGEAGVRTIEDVLHG